MGLGEGPALWCQRSLQLTRRALAFIVVAGFGLMACTPKTPEQRHAERVSRLTKQIEKLQAQIHEEQ